MLQSKSIFILTVFIFLGYSSNAQKFEFFFEKGQEYVKNGNFKTAVLYFDTAIKIEPQFANSYFNRALVKDQLNDVKGAVNDLNNYIILVPKDASAYYYRGLMKYFFRDTSGSIIDCDLSLLINPKNIDARLLRGKLLGGIDSISLSQEDFTYAYKLDSTNDEVIYYKGVTHYYLKELDTAIKYLLKSNNIDTNRRNPYHFIAKCYYLKKDYTNALININKALSLDSNDDLNYVARALIYINNENKEDDNLAKVDLYKALEMGSLYAKKIIEEYYSKQEDEDPD
jgi:tetratricopeptide (TPR) repeat protein